MNRSKKSCSKCSKNPVDCFIDNAECAASTFCNSGKFGFHYFWDNQKHKVYVVYFLPDKIEYCLFENGVKQRADGMNTFQWVGICSYDSYIAKYPFIV